MEEAVRDERNDEMEGVDEDEDEDEFSLIESDTLRRECENLRAVGRRVVAGKSIRLVPPKIAKELQTLRITKEALFNDAKQPPRKTMP